MLHLDDLRFSYAAIQTLHGITARMAAGRVTCVIGRNGVGKTTLLKVVMGILKADGGALHLGEDDVTGLSASQRARSGIALVPQGRQIFPKLSVEDNLRIGLEATRPRLRKVPQRVYDLFPILWDNRQRPGGNLSGGMQQQLAIARALVTGPRVLLLDEPTEGIQPNIIQHIGEVLSGLVNEENMTVVLVEQYLDFVKEFGDDFYIMNRGRITAEGETANLTQELISEFLGV